MTEDRRSHDPFAPAPPRRPVPEPEPEPAAREPLRAVELPEQDPGDGLEGIRKADLIQVAADEGLDTDGTKADLIARIREARQG